MLGKNFKAISLIIIDGIFFIPRLALNIIKLVTEVFPLILRELAYTFFEGMLEGAKKTPGIPRGLYKFAAEIFWLLTSLCNVVYFVGCLISSPGYTILAIKDTFKELGYPRIGNLVAGVTCLALLGFYLLGHFSYQRWEGLWHHALVGLASLAFLTEHGESEWFSYPETKMSIQPNQFMKIFVDDKNDLSELDNTSVEPERKNSPLNLHN